jgi:transposase InsO family protein
VKLQFVEPGRPIRNAFIESSNGRLREGRLNEHVFVSLGGARYWMEKWRIESNRERPHSRLGHLTAEEFAARNQRISAIARTAWPANQATSGAAQRASTSDQNLIVFVRP